MSCSIFEGRGQIQFDVRSQYDSFVPRRPHGNCPSVYDRVEPVGQGDARSIRQRKSIPFVQHDVALGCSVSHLQLPFCFSFAVQPFPFSMCGRLTERGTDSIAETGLHPAPTRLPGRHVRQRHRSSLVLPLRRFQISRSRLTLPQGGAQRAVETVDVADAARTDVETRSGQTSRLHLGRRRFRARRRRRLRRLLHHRR